MARQEIKSTSSESKSNAKIKETLDFLLHAYRAKLAVDNPSENCPFDFTEFLENWKDKYGDWSELKGAITRDLEPLANEGLFDSILPYLTASLNQSGGNKEHIKKPLVSSFTTKDFTGIPVISAELTPLCCSTGESTSGLSSNEGNGRRISGSAVNANKESKQSRKHGATADLDDNEFDPEIIIHVCDEAKGFKKDFYCYQSILVKEMGYFTKVTVKGQRLRDMDISVHCDISVFEWLIKWVKSRNGGYEQPPVLDSVNVIGLMVSADFLQMNNLVEECLQYTADNIGQIINHSPNLGCLNESLTNRILHFFNNFELETRINHIDKSDRITSRLYTQLIMALNDPEPDENLGHYASTASLFRCNICSQLLINNVASKVPCCTVKCDCRGRVYACHMRDPNWTLSQFIRDLKKELKLWKKVYWRLWSIVHFFCCSHCQQYFSANDFSSCRFHPAPTAASVVIVSKIPGDIDENSGTSMLQHHGRVSSARRSVQLRKDIDTANHEGSSDTIICPYGIYPCCKQPSYQFCPFPSSTGCEFKDHVLSQYPEDDPVLKLINSLKDLIVVTPSPSDKSVLDWAALIELTPQKLPSSSSTANVISQRVTASSLYGFGNAMASQRRLLFNMESSSTESNSLSDNEDLLPKTDENIFLNQRYSSVSDFWSWNPEYTTRYNQDMQREREEKLMADLEILMAQRVAIDSAGHAGFPSTIRLGYLSRRTQKNNGGSFLKLEEKWKEELQQSGPKSAKLLSKVSKM